MTPPPLYVQILYLRHEYLAFGNAIYWPNNCDTFDEVQGRKYYNQRYCFHDNHVVFISTHLYYNIKD